MKFSICIPNFNYEKYLGQTIQSVLDQTGDGFEFEIVIADNASTDGSVAVVESFADPRIKLKINRCNVGFARNLDKAAQMATGDVLIMLSSDDLMRPDALATYTAIYQHLPPPERDHTILCSSWDVIDSDGSITGYTGPNWRVWHAAERIESAAFLEGRSILKMRGDELLRRCLLTMTNPFNFCTVAYPRALYQAVEGYGGGRFINPDKWFNWRLLSMGDGAIFVDRALFAYRWHANNQTAQQRVSGALKYLMDEYASTFEISHDVLEKLSLSRAEIERAFIKYDIARHGLAELAKVGWHQARRILAFGRAAYPRHTRRSANVWLLSALLALGPLAKPVAKLGARWRKSV